MIDWYAALLFLLFLCFTGLMSRFVAFKKPLKLLGFSRPLLLSHRTWKTALVKFPKRLHLFAFFLFGLAFLRPEWPLKEGRQAEESSSLNIPKQGVAIYLVLDRSGSMKEPSSFKSKTKLEMLKEVTLNFINSHTNDLIGLVYFARVPLVIAPLTLDHQMIIRQLKQLSAVPTQEEDGTGIGYAIYKTAKMIAATDFFSDLYKNKKNNPYTVKNKLIILVTDGFQDPNALDYGNRLRMIDLEEATDYAKAQKIRVYLLNVDPSFGAESFAPHRRLMKKITEKTGGAFYLVSKNENLEDLYAKIDQIEKSPIEEEKKVAAEREPRKAPLAPYFLAIGLFAFISAFLIEQFILKKVPL